MEEKKHLTKLPPPEYFKNCVFICVDLQEDKNYKKLKEPVHISTMPEAWKDMGFTLDDVNAAIDYDFYHCIPNAVIATEACRAYGMPMIFVHWGSRYENMIDIDPEVIDQLHCKGPDGTEIYAYSPSAGTSPASYLNVQPGEYVLAKTAQDTFAGTPILFMLQNLKARNLVLIGGHTGACLGKTSKSAKKNGFQTLCVEDATNNAFESNRIERMLECNYDYIITAQQLADYLQELKSSRE